MICVPQQKNRFYNDLTMSLTPCINNGRVRDGRMYTGIETHINSSPFVTLTTRRSQIKTEIVSYPAALEGSNVCDATGPAKDENPLRS